MLGYYKILICKCRVLQSPGWRGALSREGLAGVDPQATGSSTRWQVKRDFTLSEPKFGGKHLNPSDF